MKTVVCRGTLRVSNVSVLSGHFEVTTLVTCFNISNYINVRMLLAAFVMGDFIGPFWPIFDPSAGLLMGRLVGLISG